MRSQTQSARLLAATAACITAAALFTPTSASAVPATLVVDDDLACEGAAYKTISAAVANASPGDTISVCTGTYRETVHVDKTLTFKGAQAGNPGILVKHDSQILAPNGAFVIEDGANNVVIDGFLMRRAGSNGSGAAAVQSTAGAGGVDVVNNAFRDNVVSVLVQNPDAAATMVIRNNAFQQNTGTDIVVNGVGHAAELTSNVFKNNGGLAIDFQGDPGELSTGVLVAYNKTANERLLSIANTDHATVISNRQVNAGSLSGTNLRDAGGNYTLLIKGNRLYGGDIGIALTADAGSPSTATTVRTTDASANLIGVLVTDDNVSAWLTRSSFYGGETGILVDSGRGNQITYNSASGGQHDCVDTTVGTDGQPLNLWRQNNAYGANSLPANICTQLP